MKVITQHGPRDFDASYEDNYIGSFKSKFEAERALDDHVLRLIEDGLIEDGLIDQPLTALGSAYTCLGCGDPLPSGRGGHCDACVEWADPAPSDPDPPLDNPLPGDSHPPGQRHLVFAYTAVPCKGCRKAIIAEAGWLCPECAALDRQARAWSRGLLERAVA